MTGHVVAAADLIRNVLASGRVVSVDELLSLLPVGTPLALMHRGLSFLIGRDEILLDLEGQTVRLRSHATQSVLVALNEAPATIDELSRRIQLPPALLCDILGWLEREGRIVILQEDNLVRLRR